MDHEESVSEHVDTDEEAAAHDPSVGTGTPATAPYEVPAVGRLYRLGERLGVRGRLPQGR